MIRHAVGAIIKCDKHWLLVHKKFIHAKNGSLQEIEGEWDFVKGGINENETFEAAVLREIYEETGIDCIKSIKQFEEKIIFEFPLEYQQNTGFVSQETTVFLCECSQANLHNAIDQEIDALGFFEANQVFTLLKHEESKLFFKKYFMDNGDCDE